MKKSAKSRTLLAEKMLYFSSDAHSWQDSGGQLYFNFSATTLHSFLKNAIVAFLCLWMHSFRRHEWTWMQRFRATSRDSSPNRPMSSLGQHFSQINLKKKQKNKPYKAFSRYRTYLSLVGLNSLLYMFFLRPPAERCFPSLSWIPLLSFQHLPLLLQLSHGLLAVFQQIKLLKNNSSCKKSL